MKDYIDPVLASGFCALIAHQLSLQDTGDKRFGVPISKIFELLDPNDPGDFPYWGIRIPLKKLLHLKPGLGLKFLGYRRSFLADREMALVPATLDELARLDPAYIYHHEPEALCFEVDHAKFEKAYAYYSHVSEKASSVNQPQQKNAAEAAFLALKKVEYKDGVLTYCDRNDRGGELSISRSGTALRKIFEFLWDGRYERGDGDHKTRRLGEDHALSNILRFTNGKSEKSVQVQINTLNKRFLRKGLKISIERIGKSRRLVIDRC